MQVEEGSVSAARGWQTREGAPFPHVTVEIRITDQKIMGLIWKRKHVGTLVFQEDFRCLLCLLAQPARPHGRARVSEAALLPPFLSPAHQEVPVG